MAYRGFGLVSDLRDDRAAGTLIPWTRHCCTIGPPAMDRRTRNPAATP